MDKIARFSEHTARTQIILFMKNLKHECILPPTVSRVFKEKKAYQNSGRHPQTLREILSYHRRKCARHTHDFAIGYVTT